MLLLCYNHLGMHRNEPMQYNKATLKNWPA